MVNEREKEKLKWLRKQIAERSDISKYAERSGKFYDAFIRLLIKHEFNPKLMKVKELIEEEITEIEEYENQKSNEF